jgi:catechol 2,3-dioxygenase-like lactoylglutathione lyase family enzyme
MARTLTEPRWTHVAIPVRDLDRSIEFYTTLTPLVVVARNEDDSGRGAWLSNNKQVDSPFVLVLAQAIDAGPPIRTLGPFAHLGIELPNKADVDAIAERARTMGVLEWEPRQLAEHIGYVCAARDPDGNVIEFSWNQKVYARVHELWGTSPAR